MMKSIKRGDIVLVYFPYSDLTTLKKRPALVVQSNHLNTGLPNIIIAKITSNLSRAGHPCTVNVVGGDRQATGLLTDSLIATDHLATIEPGLLVKKIGQMTVPLMQAVDAALRVTLAL